MRPVLKGARGFCPEPLRWSRRQREDYRDSCRNPGFLDCQCKSLGSPLITARNESFSGTDRLQPAVRLRPMPVRGCAEGKRRRVPMMKWVGKLTVWHAVGALGLILVIGHTTSILPQRSPAVIPAVDSLRFISIGDFGVTECGRRGEEKCKGATQARVARSMDDVSHTFKPHFLLSLGDNFYPNASDDLFAHSHAARPSRENHRLVSLIPLDVGPRISTIFSLKTPLSMSTIYQFYG
eukprot:jgi/Bigna1/68435/fgenesh1_pg.6_\